ARGGAEHGLLTTRLRVRHGHRHTAGLERPGRAEALDLEVHLAPGDLGEVRRADERGAALVERHRLPVGADRETIAVGLDEAGPPGVHGVVGVAHSVSTPSRRMTLVMAVTASWSDNAATVSASARSDARWVRTVSSADGSTSSN